MLVDLFGNLITDEEIIRTLGFYQPYASLMLHGKIETRWCSQHRKPGFPLGKYLFYSTKKSCDHKKLLEWCGGNTHMIDRINYVLKEDETKELNGYAIGMGDLVRIRLMDPRDEPDAYVSFVGKRIFKEEAVWKYQYCLEFKNIKPIKPFPWAWGGQGINYVRDEARKQIEFI